VQVTAARGTNRDSSVVIIATLRDLQWRARRFVIAGLGASVVFAITLVLSGLYASFSSEASRMVDAVDADSWVVQHGVKGVFTSPSIVPEAMVQAVANEPGVQRADPIIVMHASADAGTLLDVATVGYVEGGLGEPHLSKGRLPTGPDELVADVSLKAGLGDQVALAGGRRTVVGLTEHLTVLAGQPVLHLRLQDARALFLGGQPVVSAVLTRGTPERVPLGLDVRTRAETSDDLLRPIKGAIGAIGVTLLLLWVVAAMVVGSVLYLSALERRQDFAVYKATGWSTRSLATGLALQAVLLSTTASLVGVVVAQLLLPLFPLNFSVPVAARALLPVVGLAVGLLASAAGLRKAVGVEPAMAFGGP
jgi:putative ABC transport system permease protein